MKIGFDAKRAFLNHTGLGNYSRTLLSSLAGFFPEHEYHLFSPRIRQDNRTETLFSTSFVHHTAPPLLGAWWRSRGLVSSLPQVGLDLYHGLSHEIPVGLRKKGIRSVVTIHDLIFYHYPEQYAWLDRQIYDRKFRYACREADLVLAISEATRKDVISLYGVPEEKVKVLYQACHPQFYARVSQSEQEVVRKRYQLPTEYLLYVGSIVPRKNLGGIVQAMAMRKSSERVPLVVIGAGGKYKEEVESLVQHHQLAPWIIWANEIAFSDFPAVYQQALAMIYPSFYEGFGLPVLEALASGIPVITSNRASLPEAGGPKSLLVDPEQPEAVAEAIQTVLTDTERVHQMQAHGRAHAERFLSEPLTQQLMDHYKEVCAR